VFGGLSADSFPRLILGGTMKRVVFAIALLGLMTTAPAFALVTSAPLPAAGITPEEMANVMTQYGREAKLAKDTNGSPMISSRAAGVKFDVTFYECHDGRCTDIQFTAGWSNAGPPRFTPDKINTWNRNQRFMRAYLSPGNILTVSLDARVARSTTGNVQEYLALWQTMVRNFKSYFRL
jgi:Putative bacterial sensory transduction regulator